MLTEVVRGLMVELMTPSQNVNDVTFITEMFYGCPHAGSRKTTTIEKWKGELLRC